MYAYLKGELESISEDDKYFVCRSYAEAPDVDGRIYIEIVNVIWILLILEKLSKRKVL